MAYTLFKSAAFGLGKASLVTVGYQLFNANGTNNGARITAGVTERPAATGIYGAIVTVPAGFSGEIRWDTGGGTPVYASTEINPQQDENPDVKTSTVITTVGTGSKEVRFTIRSTLGVPVPGAAVWITSGLNSQTGIIAGVVMTDAQGMTPILYLDPGDVYVWAQRSGENFANPTKETVAA